jgi:hypothetical protein
VRRGHDLNYIVTGLSRAATPHVYVSTVIDETPCDIACAFSWPLAMAKGGNCSGTISDSRRG